MRKRGRINRPWLETLIEDLLRLRKRNQQVILVSLGCYRARAPGAEVGQGAVATRGEPGRRRRRADSPGARLQGVAGESAK